MQNSKYKEILIISGICGILAFSFLVSRVSITKETGHLPYAWVFLILTSQLLLIIHGILNNSFISHLPALIILFGILYILYIKITTETNNNIVNNQIESELKIKNIL